MSPVPRERLGTVRRFAGLVVISAIIVASVAGRALTEPAPRSALAAGTELAQPVVPAGSAAASAVPSTPAATVKPRTKPKKPGRRKAAGQTTPPPRSPAATRHTTPPRPTSTRTPARTAVPAAAPTTTTAVVATTPRTFTGAAFDVGYGVVQVRVTFLGRRLTDVTAISLPQGGRSSDISAMAGPQLSSEALTAQSAAIDAVSGASYTSAGYAKSLQSAIDQAAR